MYMPYTKNPHLPKVRMDTVRLVRSGWSLRRTARYTGVQPSTVLRWMTRASYNPRARRIPTLSSRPHHHPAQLSSAMIQAIIQYRLQYRRCAEVLHHLLVRDGYAVSLSSVKRTLKREGLIHRSPWKRLHRSPERPTVEKPGDLVELDTIHTMHNEQGRLYVYTLIDVCSRWAHAMVSERITTHRSLTFVRLAQQRFHTPFRTLQSDHGPEFSTWFTEHVQKRDCIHRHSRVRMPSDNGHLERFNRTVQEECLKRIPTTVRAYKKALPEYLLYYNTERPHLALNMQTPCEVLRSY